MKTTNRTITALIAAVLMLSMSACGNKDSNDNDSHEVKVRNPSSSTASYEYESSSADTPKSTETTVTEATTTVTETTAETESAPAEVDPHAYDGIKAYEPKNDDEKAAMDAFASAITAIKDEDTENILRYTNAFDIMDGNGDRFTTSTILSNNIEDYEKKIDYMHRFFSLPELHVADDGSYVITNLEEVHDVGMTEDIKKGKGGNGLTYSLYAKHGFVLEHFLTVGDIASIIDDVDKCYLVTFVSNVNGENEEYTLAVPHKKDGLVEYYGFDDSRHWILDGTVYHDIIEDYNVYVENWGEWKD